MILALLASYITDKNDIIDPNVVKVHIDQTLKGDNFLMGKRFFSNKKEFK